MGSQGRQRPRRRSGGRRRSAAALLLALAVAVAALAGCGESGDTGVPPSDWVANRDALAAAIRKGLREHASSLTLTFSYGSDLYGTLNSVIESWVEEALAETEDPAEGDYIRYQYGGYTYRSAYTVSEGRWYYTVELVPAYYCYLSQEQAAGREAARLLEDFSFGSETGAAEKIRAVYDYLCRTVTYDKVHRKYARSHLKSTAYAALVRHTATCQGYCTALYRLLRSAGVNCRIVTGAAGEGGELHAWVIAEVEGLYYNLDPTWDAGQETYRYCLAGTEDFTDHLPGERFMEAAFVLQYPMAEQSYVFSGA